MQAPASRPDPVIGERPSGTDPAANGQPLPDGLSAEAVDRVRPMVRDMLTQIPAYSEMERAEQLALANNMVKLLAYVDDPNGVVSDAMADPVSRAQAVRNTPLAAAQADANEQTRKNLSKSPGFAGKDFEAGAARQGTDQFVRLVNEVDFPSFVGGLIQNVFISIVQTSIEQMRAYAELVANVAKSAEEYMSENIGVGQARDYLVERFPDLLDVDVDHDGNSRLRQKDAENEGGLAEIQQTMGMTGPPVEDLSEEEEELRLVNAARLMMAKSRQQLLASMVMLGINRIVVTDGSITAKVKFNMRSTDLAERDYKASAYDRQSQRNKNTSFFGGSFLGFGGGSVNVNTRSHVATVKTSVDESSESKLDLSAKMQGEVRVNFKSDYMPLEKMATPEMIGAIQGNAAPASKPAAPQQAGEPGQ
jgi:hypothetical protein